MWGSFVRSELPFILYTFCLQNNLCVTEIIKYFEAFHEKWNLIRERKKNKSKERTWHLDDVCIQTLLNGFPADLQSQKMLLWETRLPNVRYHSEPSLRSTPPLCCVLHYVVYKENITYSAAHITQRHRKTCFTITGVDKSTLLPVWGALEGNLTRMFALRHITPDKRAACEALCEELWSRDVRGSLSYLNIQETVISPNTTIPPCGQKKNKKTRAIVRFQS